VTTTSTRLSPGDPAPDFTLQDSEGRPVGLSDLLQDGRRVILYFYPAAMTPGCTKESCDFRDNLREFEQAGLSVVGVSPDTPDKLRRFRESEGLTFPLLSDTEREVLAAYGAYGEKKNYGKVVQGVIRSTVVIAPDGTVERGFYNVKATGHVERLKKELGV
jgi:thioredoxin-dependent peroxiredoxin